MQINKFKKVGKSKYKIIFDHTDLTLYEDVILKYDLLIKKEVDIDLIDKIIEENKVYEAYHSALSYIEIKMRNRKEIYNYLNKKGFDDNLINETIDKLDNLNLLNNDSYISAYINDKVNLTTDGPYKIKNSLIELDFDGYSIDKYLNKIDDSVWQEKLKKLINKKSSMMKSKSYFMFINKLKNDLYNLGYSKDMIEENLSNIEYVSNAIDKDFNRARNKYKDDKNKIINYLLRKGYSYNDILNCFEN